MNINYDSENDWYISNFTGVWNIAKKDGTDAFSINIGKHLDCKAIVNDFNKMTFVEFKSHVETYWRNNTFDYLVYIMG